MEANYVGQNESRMPSTSPREPEGPKTVLALFNTCSLEDFDAIL